MLTAQVKTILSVLLAVVVVVGGYFALRTAPQTANAPVESSDNANKKMAFADFMKSGGTYKCTVNQSVNGVDTKGTTYLDNGMIRGEFSNKIQGYNIDVTFIVREGFTYTWTSMMPNTGFKSKVMMGSTSGSNAGTSGSYSFNAEQIGDYDCQPWNADTSMFTIPANITFTSTGY